MPDTLVSVIIPTFNHIKYIEETIDSVLSQTYSNIEILIIDDGSDDGTSKLISQKYENEVKYYFQENSGLSSARNLGLEKAKGSLIQFLDSDDLLTKNKIESQVSFLNANIDFDVVYSNCKTFISDKNINNKWGRENHFKNGKIFESILENPFLLPCMCLSRASFLLKVGKFDTKLSNCVDYDFWLRAAMKNGKFFFLNDNSFALYRVRKDSLSQDSINLCKNGISVLIKIENFDKALSKQQQKIIVRAKGDWIFKKGRAEINNGLLLKGYKNLISGILSNQKNFFYKFSVIVFSIILEQKKIDFLLKKIISLFQFKT